MNFHVKLSRAKAQGSKAEDRLLNDLVRRPFQCWLSVARGWYRTTYRGIAGWTWVWCVMRNIERHCRAACTTTY